MNFIRKVGHFIKRAVQIFLVLVIMMLGWGSYLQYADTQAYNATPEGQAQAAKDKATAAAVAVAANEIEECRRVRSRQLAQGIAMLKNSMKNPASFDEFWTYRVENANHFNITYSATNGYGATIQETAIIPVTNCGYK